MIAQRGHYTLQDSQNRPRLLTVGWGRAQASTRSICGARSSLKPICDGRLAPGSEGPTEASSKPLASKKHPQLARRRMVCQGDKVSILHFEACDTPDCFAATSQKSSNHGLQTRPPGSHGAREGAKSTVAEATGTNGQPKVILEHGSGALAEIYAHGATVT